MSDVANLPRRPRGRPPRNGIGFADTRALLIRCGVELLTQQGVRATVIDEVLKRVNVPKGSFYHYFASKEAFGAALLDAYFENYQCRLAALSVQPDQTGAQR